MKKILPLAMITSLATLLGWSVPAPAGSTPATAGLQLWSLRDELKKDVPAALKFAASLGIKAVETAGTYGLSPEKYRQAIEAAGLKAISGHFGFDAWAKDPAAVAAEAKALGLHYAGVAWIPHKAPFTPADVQRAAEVFNRAGAACAQAGIQFFYHIHGYEFQPQGDATLMDALIRACDPQKVSFQMDTTWVFFPGQDPAAWLRKYPGRWSSLHLKDLKKGVARGSLAGKTDKENDVPLGQGQLDWPGIFKAAREVGVKFYIIEDEAPTVAQQLPQTLQYLQQFR
ncbi:MAG: sugar phosphate isomerase/epimerase [Opitutae bacterium]|nr:sugar phosphate isomerase/epimerase [Opitutae bacterium]